MLSSRTLSDLIVDYLTLLGVEYVFGVPGGHIGGLYEALDRSALQGGPRAILCRQESGAAFMAAGYARETGKLGVCCGTTSPGTTNLITGVAAADADQDSILVLSGQTMLAKFGRGAFQESSPDVLDVSAMMNYCCSYNTLVTHPQQLEPKLASALMTALRPPRGAAHLSIPADIYRTPWPQALAYPQLPQLLQAPHALMDVAAVERLWQEIQHTRQAHKKIVIFIGHTCHGAAASIMQLAERLNAVVLTSQSGKNWVNPYHPLVRGVFGFAGHASARAVLEDPEVELIIAAGARLGQWATSSWDSVLLNEKLVHIHPHPFYLQRSLSARLQIHGEVQAVFAVLIEKLRDTDSQAMQHYEILTTPKGQHPPHIVVNHVNTAIATQTPINPQDLMQRMMRDFPDDTRLIVDAGNCLGWTIHYFFNRQPHCYQLSLDTASMAWGISAAVGIAMGNRNVPVVCIAGDGAWLMSSHEMSVAVAEGLPIIFIVLNDHCYNMINQNQNQKSQIKLNFPIPPTDFSLIAKGLGGHGYVIRNMADWDNLDIAKMLQGNIPILLDVRIDQSIIAPLGMS